VSQSPRVLIIGVGSIGHRHLRCFQATGRARLSICEVNRDLGARIAAQYGIACNYASLNEALADEHDAAVIAVPAHLHVVMATRLAELGMHLLIEKPLSASLDGVAELCRTVRRRGVVAAVAYIYHSHPVLRAMKEAIDAGRFGRPVQVVVTSGHHFPTYRPAYREIYYADRATGGGAIQDALTHMVNLSEWLVGPIDRVLADAEHMVLEGVEVEDTVHMLARHGRVMASYSLNQYQAPGEVIVTVVCEGATARFEAHRHRWRWMTKPDESWHDEAAGEIPRDALFVAQANGFLDALAGAPSPCTLEEGIQTLRVNLAALASIESGTWQRVRPGT